MPPLAVDCALAAAIGAATVWLGSEYQTPGFRPFDRGAVVLTCLVAFPLALRRRMPVPVLLVTCTMAALYFSLGNLPGFNVLSPLLALYTVVATARLATALCCAAVTGAAVFCSGISVFSAAAAATQALVATAAAWVFGFGARRLASRNEQLLELTRQLRQQREERAHTAVLEERVRLARELHDVVAHHMSVISVHAGLAGYVLPADPEAARESLRTIADTSHEALAEMRRLLAVLRMATAGEDLDGSASRPAPGLGRLDELAQRVTAAGVPVAVTVTGRRQPLAPGADLCVFRVIQEALTNVLKHARPARATVDLAYLPTELTVAVRDDGPGPRPGDDPATGHGLVGMRERTRLYGGTITAGPGRGGGFEVTLRLPLPAAPPEPSTPAGTPRAPAVPVPA